MSTLLPIVLVLAAMASVQMGASIAKTMFPAVGPIGMVAVRIALGSLVLCLLMRPWRDIGYLTLSDSRAGGSLVLQPTFNAEEALDLMQKERVTFPNAWPHQWAQLEAAANWSSEMPLQKPGLPAPGTPVRKLAEAW